MSLVSVLERIIERARTVRRRVVFPEATEPRTLRAVQRLASSGIVRPILVGSKDQTARAAESLGVDLAHVPLADPHSDPRRARYEESLREALVGKRPEEIASLLDDPMVFALCMVRAGDADGSVAGASHTTAE